MPYEKNGLSEEASDKRVTGMSEEEGSKLPEQSFEEPAHIVPIPQTHNEVILTASTKSEEELIESVLSLELVQTFSKISNVKALKPITSAIESNLRDYYTHWKSLLRYELFCKMTATFSDFAPSYHQIQPDP